MGNTFRKCITCNKENEAITLLLLGLHNSGKTELAHRFCNIQRTDYAPTKGCCIYETSLLNNKIKLLEIGGSEEFRKIWKHYFLEIMGVVFVINSHASLNDMNLSKDLIASLISHKYLTGKPFLIIATHQDERDAFDMMELCEFLEIELLANRFKTPCLVEFSGLSDHSPIFYSEINSAFHWLLQTIHSNYKVIKNHIKFNRTNSVRSLKRTMSSTSGIKRVKVKKNKMRPYTAPSNKSSRIQQAPSAARHSASPKAQVIRVGLSSEQRAGGGDISTSSNVAVTESTPSTWDLEIVCREIVKYDNNHKGMERPLRHNTLIIDDLSNDESNKENQYD